MFPFSKVRVFALVRTAATYLYAYLLVQVPVFTDILPQEVFVLIVGTLLYDLIRTLAERFSWIGYLLIINHAPSYPSAGVYPTIR